MIRRPPRSTLFPYTRSSDLLDGSIMFWVFLLSLFGSAAVYVKDRKSTRLNSSHVSISYAVFCLKKKKNKKIRYRNTILNSVANNMNNTSRCALYSVLHVTQT